MHGGTNRQNRSPRLHTKHTHNKTDLGAGLREGVAVDADVGEGPAVQVLGEVVEAGDKAVHQALDRVVLRLARLLDEGLLGWVGFDLWYLGLLGLLFRTM